MDFLKTLDDNSILIIPNNIKDKVLDYIDKNNLLLNIKIMNFNDLKKSLYFDYDNQAINYIMKKKNTSYNIAKDNINNLYYVIDYDSQENKIKELKQLYKELIDKELIYIDTLFIDLLKSKSKVYVYGFDYINKFNTHLIEKIKEIKEVIIFNKENKNIKHIVNKASTLEEEVLYVAEEISKLINSNVPLNKIFITGIDNDYTFTIKRIFKEYNIPLFIRNENILYDTAMTKYFFDILDNNIEVTLNKIKSKYDLNNINNKTIYDKLVKLVDNYYWSNSYTDVKDLMIEQAKTITLPSVHMKNEIVTTNILDNIFYDDEYVFLLNFNMNVFPKVYKDEDYINDSIKPSYLDKSSELNIINKEAILKAIGNITNITITYKTHSSFKEYLPSYLIRDYYEEKPIEFTISNYSDKINELLYAKNLDHLIKYNISNNNLSILNSNYSIAYNTYNNEFKGINNKIENINYSYSNMSKYFACPFKFYLSSVLYIDEYTKTFNTFIGSLFHSVLENCIKDRNKDIDEAYDEFIKNNNNLEDTDSQKYILNYHDEFFIEKIRNEIHIIMDIINEQYKFIDNDYIEFFEKETKTTTNELGLNTKINAVIKGIVDKYILIDNDIIIIDYKTGVSDKIDRNTFEYGLHIQLPIYLYLLEKLNPEYNIAGIYLQKILTGNNTKDIKKTQLEKRKEELKLDGLTTNDTSIISKFDSNYRNSEMIKKGKNGSRDLTEEDKLHIKNNIENLITDCINNVYDANFEIKPINIDDGKEDGCKYCSFKDVCYMKKNQYKYIYTKKDGDDNE